VVKLGHIGKTVGVRLLTHVNREIAVDGIDVLAVSGKDSALLVVTSNGATITAGMQKIMVPSVWTETMLADAGIVEASARVDAWKKWNSKDAKEDKARVETLNSEIEEMARQMAIKQTELDQIRQSYGM
jgi:hypothetical protein